MAWTLAIDFGTTNTTAAVDDRHARAGSALDAGPRVLRIDRQPSIPSVVYRDRYGNLVAGSAAAEQSLRWPQQTERVPKRKLVTGDAVLGGAAVRAVDMVAAVFRHVAEQAKRQQGGPPRRLVLTHPATWHGTELRKLADAAEAAGLPRPDIDRDFVSEPVAAAYWYLSQPQYRGNLPDGSVVAVYDLGGGTLDTAVLRLDGDTYSTLAVGGNARLGGEDFDEALMDIFVEQAEELDRPAWLRLGEGPDGRLRMGVLHATVVETKEKLSKAKEAVQVHVPGFGHQLHVTRGAFAATIHPELASAVDELRRTFARAGVQPGDVAKVFLSGGSTRIPRVSETIATGVGQTPLSAADPKAVVALGALEWAAAQEWAATVHRVNEKAKQREAKYAADLAAAMKERPKHTDPPVVTPVAAKPRDPKPVAATPQTPSKAVQPASANSAAVSNSNADVIDTVLKVAAIAGPIILKIIASRRRR